MGMVTSLSSDRIMRAVRQRSDYKISAMKR